VNPERFKALLERVASGGETVADALRELESWPTGRLGYATLDLHRAVRTGMPEVVYGEGKPADKIAGILTEMRAAGHAGMVTRLAEDKAAAVRVVHPDAVWHPIARILHLPSPERSEPPKVKGTIAVVAAGTSDLPVAEEAAVTAEIFGSPVSRHWDVGVAGIHRILDQREAIQSAAVVIVVAGMEGALASVVAGIVDRPIIGVPTSVGYGASFGGIAALLGMLNSCAPGVSVVNIDNGFGAAVQATKINRLAGKP
jgi:pyridinium-3,5-biscarboxylic acid mononucleotide synthase